MTKKQMRVLNKLAHGAYLDPCGKDDLGGWCWTDDKNGFRVSVADMTFLLSNSLIEYQDAWHGYKITDAWRKVVPVE